MTIPSSPRATQVRDEASREVFSSIEEDGESTAAILVGAHVEQVAEMLAQLDFELTGQACYGLSWVQRFERVRTMRDRLHALEQRG